MFPFDSTNPTQTKTLRVSLDFLHLVVKEVEKQLRWFRVDLRHFIKSETMSQASVDGFETFLDSLASLPTTIEINEADEDDDEGLTVVTAGVSPIRNNKHLTCAMLTIFPESSDRKYLDPSFLLPGWEGSIRNWCGQFELCPTTARLHAHIYVEFNRSTRPRFLALQKALEKVVKNNIKAPNRVSQQSISCGVNYVLKPDGRLAGTETFIWSQNKSEWAFDQPLWEKKGKSKKKEHSDRTEEQRALIETFAWYVPWADVLHHSLETKTKLCNCSWGKKYHEARAQKENPRKKIQNVCFWYGAGGTGKTTSARKLAEATTDKPPELAYYKRNPSEDFWGGGATAYKGQDIIHFDEFCGNEPFFKFKEYCDIGNEGPPIKIKNSGGLLNHDTVVVTSNYHPAAWYYHAISNDEKSNWVPFWRRVTDVRFYPEFRPDGSKNTPTDEHEPYYVDKTEEWKAFKCWDDCKEHAESHWPLPESYAEGDGGEDDDGNVTNKSRGYNMFGFKRRKTG